MSAAVPTLGDRPAVPGIYCVRQWYAWRILEWDGTDWWHEGKVGKWPWSAQLEAYFGPLPRIIKDHTKPAPHRGRDSSTLQHADEEDEFANFRMTPPAPAQEFDL